MWHLAPLRPHLLWSLLSGTAKPDLMIFAKVLLIITIILRWNYLQKKKAFHKNDIQKSDVFWSNLLSSSHSVQREGSIRPAPKSVNVSFSVDIPVLVSGIHTGGLGRIWFFLSDTGYPAGLYGMPCRIFPVNPSKSYRMPDIRPNPNSYN